MDTHSRHAPAVPPPGIAIVPMHPDHLDSLADLESLAFSTPWSYDALAEELQNPLAVFLVAEDVDAESAVGYLGMHHILDEGFIANLAVHPAYRRQGHRPVAAPGGAGVRRGPRPCPADLGGAGVQRPGHRLV